MQMLSEDEHALEHFLQSETVDGGVADADSSLCHGDGCLAFAGPRLEW